MTVGSTLLVEVLAQEPAGPEFGKASPFGLALVVVLLVATALLVWNMNKQLRKLPETFEPEHPEADQAVDDGTLPGPTPDATPTTDQTPSDSDRTPPSSSN